MGGRQPGAGLALGSPGLHPGFSVSQQSLFLEHLARTDLLNPCSMTWVSVPSCVGHELRLQRQSGL